MLHKFGSFSIYLWIFFQNNHDNILNNKSVTLDFRGIWLKTNYYKEAHVFSFTEVKNKNFYELLKVFTI